LSNQQRQNLMWKLGPWLQHGTCNTVAEPTIHRTNCIIPCRDSGRRLTASKSTPLWHSRIPNSTITLEHFCFQLRLWLLYSSNNKRRLHQNLSKFLRKLSTDGLLTTHVGKQFHKSDILPVKEYLCKPYLISFVPFEIVTSSCTDRTLH